MVNFTELFKNMSLLGLIMLGLFSFTFILETDNGVTDKLEDNSLIGDTYGDLRGDLAEFRNESQGQKGLFESENPTQGAGSILLFSIVSSGKVFNNMIVGVFNSLIKFPSVILGIDPVIISVIVALLILTIIFGLWSVYKLGG